MQRKERSAMKKIPVWIDSNAAIEICSQNQFRQFPVMFHFQKSKYVQEHETYMIQAFMTLEVKPSDLEKARKHENKRS